LDSECYFELVYTDA